MYVCMCVLVGWLLCIMMHAGINLPRLDQATPHYGGAWAAAGTTIFTDIFKVGRVGGLHAHTLAAS